MRKTVKEIKQSKNNGEKLTMLTAYDASMAGLLAQCDIDMLLVGDSLGMVMLGYDSTVTVSMDEMIHHCGAVRRGAPDTFVVGDMPFGSYQTGRRDAVTNGIRFLKEGGCDAVKLEGGLEVCKTIEALVQGGVSVMAHIGLTPQTASQLGGYKVQGNSIDSARKIIEEAKALEAAGAFAVLMECVPVELAEKVSEEITIPTIGIGAGGGCGGQVLVINDLLGLFERFTPKFVKKYANLADEVKRSVGEYCQEVRSGAYPAEEHSFYSKVDLSKEL